MDGRTDALTVGRMDQQPAFDSTGGKPPFLRSKNLAHLAVDTGSSTCLLLSFVVCNLLCLLWSHLGV